jgi:hypothetical protein
MRCSGGRCSAGGRLQFESWSTATERYGVFFILHTAKVNTYVDTSVSPPPSCSQFMRPPRLGTKHSDGLFSGLARV